MFTNGEWKNTKIEKWLNIWDINVVWYWNKETEYNWLDTLRDFVNITKTKIDKLEWWNEE